MGAHRFSLLIRCKGGNNRFPVSNPSADKRCANFVDVKKRKSSALLRSLADRIRLSAVKSAGVSNGCRDRSAQGRDSAPGPDSDRQTKACCFQRAFVSRRRHDTFFSCCRDIYDLKVSRALGYQRQIAGACSKIAGFLDIPTKDCPLSISKPQQISTFWLRHRPACDHVPD
jgi:hypothetical protein